MGTCVIGSNIEFADSSKRWFAAPSGMIDSLYDNTPIVYTTADVSNYEINDNVTTYYPSFDIIERAVFESAAAGLSAEYGV